MPHHNRITIRLTPRQVRALRAIVQAFHERPTVAGLVGLGCEEVAAARDALMHIPVIANAAYPLTPDTTLPH